MGRPALLAVCVTLLVAGYDAKVWEQCELARTLLNTYNIARAQIPTWVCIAKFETNFDDSYVNTNNGAALKYYGMYQSSNQYWCHSSDSPSPDQNQCEVECNTLTTNFAATINCAKTMYANSGNSYTPWSTYANCSSNVESYIAGCGI